MPTEITQSLGTAGTILSGNEPLSASSFQSALQAFEAVSSLLNPPDPTDIVTDPVTGNPASLSSVLLQALESEDATREMPLVAPYRLGLRAVTEMTSQARTLNPDPARLDETLSEEAQLGTPRAQDPAVEDSELRLTLNPLEAFAGEGLAPTVPDPTSSTLFQSHLGAMATNPLPAATLLNPGFTEMASLRVAETYAGAATSAFSEGQPLSQNYLVQTAARPERVPLNPSQGVVSTESVAATYTPRAVMPLNGARIGAILDLQD